MQLNLPVLEQLSTCKNLLIAGMGGGFDIFCGLPIYFELRARDQTVHLANYSFSLLTRINDAIHLNENVAGINANCQSWSPYFPELYLSQWFREKHGEDVTVWCFQKTGVRPLLEGYLALVEHLSIDGILLIDGGVDSLMQGDEPATGTIIEDSISLCAVNELKRVPLRMTTSVGFGAEQDMSYFHVFENIAALAHSDHFYGSCSLIKQMEAYQLYEDALLSVQAHHYQDPSVINSSIVSAVQGHYGNFHLTSKTSGSKLWISPLMPIYWFFDLAAVARRNLLLPEIRYTDSLNDVIRILFKSQSTAGRRKPAQIPLK